MSGRRSRTKGARTERGIVNALKASGIAAVRVPLSGAVGGRFAGDIMLPLMGRDLCVEVKARADGFRELYSWLNQRDVLIVKADRQEPLVVVRLSLAAEIAKAGSRAMSRRRRIPVRGDIPAAMVAELLGLSVSDFNAKLVLLHERGFPSADLTTGLYCIEAVDRWRLRRHAQLLPELTTAPAAAHAGAVFDDRLRRLNG